MFAHSTLPLRAVAEHRRAVRVGRRPAGDPAGHHRVRPRLGVHGGGSSAGRCRTLGISVQPARPYTPTDKAIVERTFNSINTLFCQHVAGYVGGNVTMRGKDPSADAVFTVAQLQDLFDEWVVAVWQNRPHESLTHLWGQGAAVSPNDAYSAMVARSGTCRCRGRQPTTWSCCRWSGGRSTMTASPTATGFTTALSSTPTGAPVPGCTAAADGGKSTTTPTTSPRSGCVTITTAGGSPPGGCIGTLSGSRSAQPSMNTSVGEQQPLPGLRSVTTTSPGGSPSCSPPPTVRPGPMPTGGRPRRKTTVRHVTAQRRRRYRHRTGRHRPGRHRRGLGATC